MAGAGKVDLTFVITLSIAPTPSSAEAVVAPDIMGYHMNTVPPKRRARPRTSRLILISKRLLIVPLLRIRDLLTFHCRLVVVFQHCRFFLLLVSHSLHTCRRTAWPTITLEAASRCRNMVGCALRARRRVRIPHISNRTLREHSVGVAHRGLPPACAWPTACSTARDRATATARRRRVDGAGFNVVVEAFDDVSCRRGFL